MFSVSEPTLVCNLIYWRLSRDEMSLMDYSFTSFIKQDLYYALHIWPQIAPEYWNLVAIAHSGHSAYELPSLWYMAFRLIAIYYWAIIQIINSWGHVSPLAPMKAGIDQYCQYLRTCANKLCQFVGQSGQSLVRYCPIEQRLRYNSHPLKILTIFQ